jgi:hypothetical protein
MMMPHDPGLAASPTVRYTLEVGGGDKYLSPFRFLGAVQTFPIKTLVRRAPSEEASPMASHN